MKRATITSGVLWARLRDSALGSNMASLTIRFAGVGLYFAQAVLLARLLGPAGFGELAVALAIVELLAVACLWGLGVYGIREVARLSATGDEAGIHAFLRSGTITILLCSLVAILGTLTLVWSGTGAKYAGLIMLAILLVFPLAHIQLCRGIAQGLGHGLQAQLPGEFLRPLVACAALVLLAIASIEVTPTIALLALAVGALVAFLIAVLQLLRNLRRFQPRKATRSEASAWRKSAAPHLGTALAQVLHLSLATLLLGALSGPEQAGLFQPVTRIALLLIIPAHAAAITYAPQIANLWERRQTRDMAMATRAFTRNTTIMTFLMAAALFPLTPLILAAFGEEFAPGIAMVQLVAATQVLVCAIGPTGWLLAMTDRAGEQLKGYVLALLAQAIAGFTLIPEYGAWGATIALCLGLVALPLSQLPATWRRTRLNCTLLPIGRA